MLGRVISASRAIGWATLPIGALVGGWLGTLGQDEDAYARVAQTFPILIVGTALWLFTTVVWRDTFGPREESDETTPVIT
jgi:hypothetical protein